MKVKAQAEPSSTSDLLKWVGVLVFISLAVAGNYFYSTSPLVYRIVGVAVLVVLAGFIFFTTAKGKQLLDLAKESRIEIRKVVWPTRQETTQTTLLVLAAVAVVAVLLWLIDSFWGWAIKALIY